MQSLFESWTPPLGTISMLLITTAIYVGGFHRLHRQMLDRFPNWRLAAFLCGIAALLVAIASPLEELDDQLLQVHRRLFSSARCRHESRSSYSDPRCDRA